MIGTLLRAFGRTLSRGRLAILIYHRVLDAPDELMPGECDVAKFTAHMDALRAHFNVLPLVDAIDRLRQGTLPPRAAAVTFDDGYADNESNALPILQQRSLSATFFVTTGMIGGSCMWNDTVIECVRAAKGNELNLGELGFGVYPISSLEHRISTIASLQARLKPMAPTERAAQIDTISQMVGARRSKHPMMSESQIQSLAAAGMEIGGHTVNHPLLSSLSEVEARQEIVHGKEHLENIIQKPVRLFAYPNGRPGKDFHREHVDMLRDLEFDAAVTTAKGAATAETDVLQLPRFTPWDASPTRFSLRLMQNYRDTSAAML